MLTWVRKKIWRQMFWSGILQKRFIRTTSNRLWQVVQHVNQRRWWLYNFWAPSKIIIFDGAQIYTVLTWVRKNVRRPMFWWGILRKRFIRTTSNCLLQVVQHVNQRRWWLYKVWAPSKIIIFDGAQIYTVLTCMSQKEGMEANVLVRHLAEEIYPNNK